MSTINQQSPSRPTIKISAQQLAEYVKNNEVPWQMHDTNITFSWKESHEFFGEDDRLENEELNCRMFNVLVNSEDCVVFDPKTDDNSCFEDLIEWTEGKDLLILVDNILLICIAPCDEEQVLAMAV